MATPCDGAVTEHLKVNYKSSSLLFAVVIVVQISILTVPLEKGSSLVSISAFFCEMSHWLDMKSAGSSSSGIQGSGKVLSAYSTFNWEWGGHLQLIRMSNIVLIWVANKNIQPNPLK